jgi:hypothetical protein
LITELSLYDVVNAAGVGLALDTSDDLVKEY